MSSRKEQKEQARLERERREAEAAKAARAKRLRAQLIAGGVAIVVIAAAAIAIGSSGGGSSGSGAPKPNVPLALAAKQAGCTLIDHPAEGHQHVTGNVQYKTNPPSSGDHYPIPASDGEYRQPPTVTHLVHALEHGRVILWYKPGSPASTVDQLRTVFNRDSSLMILTPNNTNMPYQVAASNWTGDRNAANPPPEVGHVLGCPTMNSKVPIALEAFIAQYKGKGPERIPQPE